MTRARIGVLPTSWITRWVVLSVRVIVTIASTLFLVALQNLLAALARIGWYKPMPMCLMICYLSDQPWTRRPIYKPIYYWSIFWSLIVLPHWRLLFKFLNHWAPHNNWPWLGLNWQTKVHDMPFVVKHGGHWKLWCDGSSWCIVILQWSDGPKGTNVNLL